jgi:t-SNARE complex subunit (syntaxin)
MIFISCVLPACGLLGTADETRDMTRKLQADFSETKDLAKRIMGDLKRAPNSSLTSKLRQMFKSEMSKLQKLQPDIAALENRFMNARKSAGHAGGDPSSPEGKAQLSQALQENQIDIQFLEYNEKDIAQRHNDILAIEQSASEVFEMFKDVQELVNEQQEGIDMIEVRVCVYVCVCVYVY